MLKFSYHNHTNYSDGLNSPEEMAQTAYESGFTHFSFTDHVYSEDYPDWTLNPDSFERYAEHINSIKKAYQGKMKIFTGIEADWYKGRKTYFSHYEELSPLLDFTVGSIHVLSPNGVNYLIDGSIDFYENCLNDGYGGNAEKMVTDYFESYSEMAAGLKPNLLAHIDIMRKNNPANRFFDEKEKWVVKLQQQLAKEIKKLGLITEVNGGGAYRYRNDTFYPSNQFLEILKDEGVKITIGLDAHSVEMVNGYYAQSVGLLKKSGYKEAYYFEDGVWKAAALEDIKDV